MKPPRSELAFASFLAYDPRGAKNVVFRLKTNRADATGETASERVAQRLRERDDVPFVDTFLGPETALVPVPRSGLLRRGALWPAWEIAVALRSRGFGSQVVPCLTRSRAVPKSARSPHAESLTVAEPLSLPAIVTLVDDVVTNGAQLFGAAWAIWSVRPDVQIRAFAVMRAVSDPFVKLDAPCTGQISWLASDECRREP